MMSESLKSRFLFPSSIIQAQAVRSLVTAVLKEKGQNERISQGVALDSLWDQCMSDSALIRSASCDALVLLVEQGHAHLSDVLSTSLNLLPSARNVQGLMRVIGKLLQLQTSVRNDEENFTCPYAIRSSPHPYITALENRPDVWPVLLQDLQHFLQQASDRDDPAYVELLAPFLRFLYCETGRRPDNALLRHTLLTVLLRPRPPPPDRVSQALTRCVCHLLPYMLVDSVASLVEFSSLAWSVGVVLMADPPFWRSELCDLSLQLLCACQISVDVGGDPAPLLRLLQQILPEHAQELPRDEVLVGVALLLLRASVPQQTALLELAVKMVPPETPPPRGAAVLVMPLLQVLSCSALMEPLSDTHTHAHNLRLAQSLLHALQRESHAPAQERTQSGGRVCVPLSSWYGEIQTTCCVLRRLTFDPPSAGEWLLSLQSSLPVCGHAPDAVCVLVSHLLVSAQGDLCRTALDTVVVIAEAEPAKVSCLLPLLLYKLSRLSDPDLSLALLYSLPRLGTHTLCVPQVLQALQTLGSSGRLRPLELRLLARLWEKQDRVYPHLQRLMSPPDSASVLLGKETQWEELLARAACVRDVCRERPYQHAGDMLAAITDTLTRLRGNDQADAPVLVLQGLHALLKAEVVDVCSALKALQLLQDTRAPVMRATARLLALLPALHVPTEEYESFRTEAVRVLWSFTLSQDMEVSCSAFEALSEYPETCHTIKHLPEAARPVLKEDEEQDDVSVPGSSYMKLIRLTPPQKLPALQLLLASLVKQEVTEMPRGVFHSALSSARSRSDGGGAVSGIPAFLLTAYEKNTQPGLKPGLAAGLLLCYDLPVHTGKEGRPIPRFLVSRGRSFQQMLSTLIHEVNIQPSEWHRSLLLPHAWRGFMARAFQAVLQGRKAELEMAVGRGKESEEQLQHQQNDAWIWVRDQLTEVIQSAAKEGPVVQGNALLALSGLTVALLRHHNHLQADAHWTCAVLDTLLGVLSTDPAPYTHALPGFLHRSYSGESRAGVMTRCCAALALALLVPVLVSCAGERVPAVMDALAASLPGSASADDSQALQFHCGLALGVFLARLQEERVSEVSGHSVAELVRSRVEDLDACCFDASLEYNSGCVLGAGLAWSALCGAGQGVGVSLALDRLQRLLQDSKSRALQEVAAYSVAGVVVAAFSAGVVSAARAEEVMDTLRSLTEESQQTPGVALALGLAVHGLSSCGHVRAAELQTGLLEAWSRLLLAEGCGTLQRLSALSGLVACAGSEAPLMQLRSDASVQQTPLSPVVRLVSQTVGLSGSLGLQSNAACLLGLLHLAQMSSSHGRAAVPQDCGYLPGRSVIRASVELLKEAGRGAAHTHTRAVQTVLGALEGACVQLPPVDWSLLMPPLMRLEEEEARHRCLMLAAAQAPFSQAAAHFLSGWLAPPLLDGLSLQTRELLHQRLSGWMRHVPEEKLQLFVEVLTPRQFESDRLRPLCRSILQGLRQAAAHPAPPAHCWTSLRSCLRKIYHLLPDQIPAMEARLYADVCLCLSELSDSDVDDIIRVTEANVEKSTFTLSFLVSSGRIPLLALNDVISTALRVERREPISWLLLQGLHQSRYASGPSSGVCGRVEWLLELMGHIRGVSGGSVGVSGDVTEATDFLLAVFAAGVVSWACPSGRLLVGVRTRWFPWQQTAALAHDLYGTATPSEWTLRACLLALPLSLTRLLEEEPWTSHAEKVIEWLLWVTAPPAAGFSPHALHTATAALLALRSRPEFQKKTVWSRAYGW